ncbi:hypothetical protein DV736_g3878, partial [Chaetothyriales sp. CBS 134916]
MFRFVDANADSFKRKHPPQRAYPSSAKPVPTATPKAAAPEARATSPLANAPASAQLHSSNTNAHSSPPPSQHAPDTDSRFIGNMNPEGVFLAARNPHDFRGQPLERNVGFWLAQKDPQLNSGPDFTSTAPPSSIFYGFNPTIQQAVLPILQTHCLSTRPPQAHRDALSSLYFQNFHPIFPILDRTGFEPLPQDSPTRIILEQGICLVASADASVASHLLLADDPEPAPRREFGKRLFAAMRVAIGIGMITNKIVLIQALGLMSLFIEGRESCDTSSLLIGQAIQHLQSLGLHIQNHKQHPELDYAGTLFCCIWMLDKLNATCQGRPVLMHERDIGRPLQQCLDAQTPVFTLVLHIIQFLDRIIHIYRPNIDDKEIDTPFPMFEDLVIQCGAIHLPTNRLATIEILYHAVAILSYRYPTAESDHPDFRFSRTRQSLSADRLTALAARDCLDQIVPFPFVPYTFSLAMTVSYREMRTSKIPLCRTRAQAAFETNCRLLKHLATFFWSAAVMAEIGELTLKELGRAHSRVADEYRRRQSAAQLGHPKGVAAAADTSTSETIELSQQDPLPIQDSNPFDFGDFGASPSDPFTLFNPNFDLSAMDAYFEANLHLNAPLNPLY